METSLNYVGEVVYTLTHNRVSDVGLIVPTLPSPRVATRASDIYDMDSYFSEYCCDEYDDSIKWNKTSVRMFLSEWKQITYNKSVEEVLEEFPIYNTSLELFNISTTDTPIINTAIPDIPTTDIPNTPTSDIQNLVNTYTRIIDAYTSVVKDLQALLDSRNTQSI